jgi:hypothetical protein
VADRSDGVLSVTEAQEARQAVSAELSAARTQMAAGQSVVAELDRRVADGDRTVSALQMLEARHTLEMDAARVGTLTEQAKAAEEALKLARAVAVAEEWNETASALRAEIRTAAQQLVAARNAVLAAVDRHNSAVQHVRFSLRGVSDPNGRFHVGTFGPQRVGTSALREINGRSLVDVTLMPEGSTRASLAHDLPHDVITSAR